MSAQARDLDDLSTVEGRLNRDLREHGHGPLPSAAAIATVGAVLAAAASADPTWDPDLRRIATKAVERNTPRKS